MAKAIDEAIDSLEKKPVDIPTQPNTNEPSVPKTGDTSNSILLLGFIAMSSLASTLVLRKRKAYIK